MDRPKLRKPLSFTTLPFRHDPCLARIDNNYESPSHKQRRPKLTKLSSFQQTSSDVRGNSRAPMSRKTTFSSYLERCSTTELESELRRRMEASNAEIKRNAVIKPPRQTLGTMALQQAKRQIIASVVEIQEEPEHSVDDVRVSSTTRIPAPQRRSSVFSSIRKKLALPLSSQAAPKRPSTTVLPPLEVKRTRKGHENNTPATFEIHHSKLRDQVQNKTTDGNKCPACLEGLKQTIRIVPCSHDVCGECFVAWQGQRSASGKHSSCPQCREFVMGIRVFSQ